MEIRKLNHLASILCIALLGATIVAIPPSRRAAGSNEDWTRLRSRNFLIIGNAGERNVRRAAIRLEQFHDALANLFNGASRAPAVPTTVIVFKDEASFRPFAPLYQGRPRDDVAGYFQPGSDVNYIALTPAGRAGNPYAVIFHEYTHLLVRNIAPRAPLWLSEGLAEYYSTFDVTDGDRRVTLGKPIAPHAALLRREFIPFERLFAIDYRSPEYNERTRNSIFYAESWALAHYLIVGNNGARRGQLAEFVRLLGTGAAVEGAFRQAFQTDFRTLEGELRAYVERNSYPRQLITLDRRLEAAIPFEQMPLAQAEATAYLGDLLSRINRMSDAESLLRQSLAVDERSALAHAALGTLFARQGRFAEARERLRRAIELEPSNYLARYYYAYTLSRVGMDGSNYVAVYEPETAELMRASLRRVIELAPEFADAYRLLVFVNLVMGEQLDESVALARRAIALAPERADFRIVLAQLQMRRKDFDAARAILEPMAQTDESSGIRESARSLLQTIAVMTEQQAQAREEAQTRRSSSSNSTSAPGAFGEIPRPRDMRPGDEQAFGTLTGIDCADTGSVTLFLRVGADTLRFHAAQLERIRFVTYTRAMRGSMMCGALNPPREAVVTYRPARTAHASSAGEAFIVEFTPQ